MLGIFVFNNFLSEEFTDELDAEFRYDRMTVTNKFKRSYSMVYRYSNRDEGLRKGS